MYPISLPDGEIIPTIAVGSKIHQFELVEKIKPVTKANTALAINKRFRPNLSACALIVRLTAASPKRVHINKNPTSAMVRPMDVR